MRDIFVFLFYRLGLEIVEVRVGFFFVCIEIFRVLEEKRDSFEVLRVGVRVGLIFKGFDLRVGFFFCVWLIASRRCFCEFCRSGSLFLESGLGTWLKL